MLTELERLRDEVAAKDAEIASLVDACAEGLHKGHHPECMYVLTRLNPNCPIEPCDCGLDARTAAIAAAKEAAR